MHWHKIAFDNFSLADGIEILIRDAFASFALSAEASPDCALFSGDDCVYVSPALSATTPQLLAQFKASPCDAPIESEDEEEPPHLLLAKDRSAAWALVAR